MYSVCSGQKGNVIDCAVSDWHRYFHHPRHYLYRRQNETSQLFSCVTEYYNDWSQSTARIIPQFLYNQRNLRARHSGLVPIDLLGTISGNC